MNVVYLHPSIGALAELLGKVAADKATLQTKQEAVFVFFQPSLIKIC